MTDIITNLKILRTLQKKGELSRSNLEEKPRNQIPGLDQHIKEMNRNGLIEKLEPSEDHDQTDTHDKNSDPIFRITDKGEFSIESVELSYTIIKLALHGKYNIERFQNAREKKENRMIF